MAPEDSLNLTITNFVGGHFRGSGFLRQPKTAPLRLREGIGMARPPAPYGRDPPLPTLKVSPDKLVPRPRPLRRRQHQLAFGLTSRPRGITVDNSLTASIVTTLRASWRLSKAMKHPGRNLDVRSRSTPLPAGRLAAATVGA